MSTGCRIHELAKETQTIAPAPNTAFKDVAHPKLPPDLTYIDRLALVDERGIPRDDEQPMTTRKRSDDFFRHAVGEIFLLGIIAHVDERQNSNRRAIRYRERVGLLGGIGRNCDS